MGRSRKFQKWAAPATLSVSVAGQGRGDPWGGWYDICSVCVWQGKDGEIPEEDAATLAMDFDVGFAIKEKVY